MTSTKISVVIPAYNAEKHICNALQSVYSQSHQPFEVIVVDDGSTDNTFNLIKTQFPQVRIISQPNAGPAKARNTGIRSSQGTHIAFLDADDIWLPNHLKNATFCFGKNPEIKWYASAFIIQNKFGKQKIRKIQTKKETLDFFQNSLKESFIHTSSIVVNSLIFEKTGLFIEKWKYGEDMNMWFRIALTFNKIGYCADPGAIFCYTKESLTHSALANQHRHTIEVIESTYDDVKKHNNAVANKLIIQWMENAALSSALQKNTNAIIYIKQNWLKKIRVSAKFVIIFHKSLPDIFLRLLLIYIKKTRKIF